MVHEDAKKVEVVFPHDPHFCTFIWNPPPTRPQSKNRDRLAKGTRNGPRKSRKRDEKGQIRQPNDWMLDHIRTLGSCVMCGVALYTFARKLGNRTGRVVLIASQIADSSLLCAIWILTKKVWEMYGVRMPNDVVHIILYRVFTMPVIAEQRLKRDQFHAPCGCKYHLNCYNEYVGEGLSLCKRHKKPII